MKTQIEQFQRLYETYLGMAVNCDQSAQMMKTLFAENGNWAIEIWAEKAQAYRFAATSLISTCALCNIFLKTEPIETKQERSILLVTSEKY